MHFQKAGLEIVILAVFVPCIIYLLNKDYIYHSWKSIFEKYIIYLLHFHKIQNNRKKGNNIERLLVVEFKENETHPFDEIMKVFRKYPDFQKYEIDYAPAISLPDLEILPDQRKVYCGKQEVSLTTKEFNLLCYFVANAGRVLTYEQIYQNVWGNYVQDIENNTIGSHVCKLREKLYKACPDRKFEIRCVREIGYCFEAK